ncbi:hypothetical protein L1987_06333 [Smallanthus sonchifolius]|uniref:Uncharacterized protein n=1 Tax=Smallanthus sonchifolius TaxID=185202 RepID=A0ACB9JXZ8_9ASTR|nr:hypothetical protein L1987_06333 [Smallanthus sonchifolius]
MVPQHSLSKDVRSCMISYMPNPNDFFNEVKKGSIKLKKSQTFSIYNTGVLIDEDNTQIEAEVVIFANGFKGVQKLKDIFESSTFGQFIAGSPRIPLYSSWKMGKAARLRLSDFLNIYNVSQEFVTATEKIGGRLGYSIRGTLQSQAKAFVDFQHESRVVFGFCDSLTC